MLDKAQAQLDISCKRERMVSGYAKLWSEMIREWRAPRDNDAVWLMYSASYLFNTRGQKWAVDPVRLSNRVPEAQMPELSEDLHDLDFVLLTHDHIDHVDVGLWSQLKGAHCHWIVPEHMTDLFSCETSLSSLGYSVAVPGKKISFAGVRITPFESPHYERSVTGEIIPIDSTGYFVETAGSSYLFPSDIRTYDPSCLQPFSNVTTVFAHVFLGRSAALVCDPPLLDAFVDFYLNSCPKKIVLSHLYELGREPEDCWLSSHAQRLAKAFNASNGEVEVLIPEWYKEVFL